MNQRPLTADELEKLSRVPLAVHDVQQLRLRGREQHAFVSGGTLVQTIRMGQLVRGAAGGCDTVQLSDWTHHDERGRRLADALARRNVRSYQGQEHVDRAPTSCAS